MKKVLLLFVLLLTANFVVNAQNYDRQICPNCGGNGRVFSGYYDYYGYPIYSMCPQCMGYGFILIPNSNGQNISFQGSKRVELKSASGGKSYGYGDYYSIRNIVVYKGVHLNVSNSDIRGYNRMIKFDNGDKWYFNY